MHRVGDGTPILRDACHRASRRDPRHHGLQAIGAYAHANREAQRIHIPSHSAERRAIPAIEPGEHLQRRDNGHATGERRRHGRIRLRRGGVVGVKIGREGAVVPSGPQGIIEQRRNRGRVRLPGLIGHL